MKTQPNTHGLNSPGSGRICLLRVSSEHLPREFAQGLVERLSVVWGSPLVWVLGRLTRERDAFDSFAAALDRQQLRLELNGRPVEWWSEVEEGGVLAVLPGSVALLHRPEGIQERGEGTRVAGLNP